MESETNLDFSMEAVKPGFIAGQEPVDVFHYVLSMPVACPDCNEEWLLLADAPVSLEIEMGLVGKEHLTLLAKALVDNCRSDVKAQHFRTDGQTVWVPDLR